MTVWPGVDGPPLVFRPIKEGWDLECNEVSEAPQHRSPGLQLNPGTESAHPRDAQQERRDRTTCAKIALRDSSRFLELRHPYVLEPLACIQCYLGTAWTSFATKLRISAEPSAGLKSPTTSRSMNKCFIAVARYCIKGNTLLRQYSPPRSHFGAFGLRTVPENIVQGHNDQHQKDCYSSAEGSHKGEHTRTQTCACHITSKSAHTKHREAYRSTCASARPRKKDAEQDRHTANLSADCACPGYESTPAPRDKYKDHCQYLHGKQDGQLTERGFARSIRRRAFECCSRLKGIPGGG